MKAIPPSQTLWWDGISMACREDTGLNNHFRNIKNWIFLDVCFEWIILMNQNDFAFFWQLNEANSAIFTSL